jgi:hypothetical protein
MSASGQKRTLPRSSGMSALPPKADMAERQFDALFVPKADIVANCTALGGPASRGRSLFSFWIDRTSSGAFVWHRSLPEAYQPT